jgi:hypothetical protein
MLAVLFLGSALILWGGQYLYGQEKGGIAKVEYKVVFSPTGRTSKQRLTAKDGVVWHELVGPSDPAAEMTKQFNALAADGWQYVGPVASPAPGQHGPDGLPGVFVVFQKSSK